jgi:hypothetical protein
MRLKSEKDLNEDILNDAESEIEIDRNDSFEELNTFVGVTNIHFPSTEPIGIMLVSFDDGTIRLWKSAVKNEQMMKIYRLEQEQQANKKGEMRGANAPVRYDISQVGYQQYDLVDKFDLFDNPHNERQDTDSDRNKIKSLYAVSKHFHFNSNILIFS